MSTPKSRQEIEKVFTARLRVWWGDGAEDVRPCVDELLADLGYVVTPQSLRRSDPIAYRLHRRDYMREYQAKRRAARAGV